MPFTLQWSHGSRWRQPRSMNQSLQWSWKALLAIQWTNCSAQSVNSTLMPSSINDSFSNATNNQNGTIFSPTASPWSAPDTSITAGEVIRSTIMLLLIMTFFCCISCGSSRFNRVDHSQGRRPTLEVASGNATNTTQRQQVDLVKSMTSIERREYIANFLKTEKFGGKPLSRRLSKRRSSSFVISQSKRNFNSSTFSLGEDAPGCAICLDQFADGEDICTSQNKHCPHQFHLMCAFKWLLKSPECPCCRRDYLTMSQSDRELGLPASTPVSASESRQPTRARVGLTPRQILAASVPPTVQVEL